MMKSQILEYAFSTSPPKNENLKIPKSKVAILGFSMNDANYMLNMRKHGSSVCSLKMSAFSPKKREAFGVQQDE